jgi:hypothetical protein
MKVELLDSPYRSVVAGSCGPILDGGGSVDQLSGVVPAKGRKENYAIGSFMEGQFTPIVNPSLPSTTWSKRQGRCGLVKQSPNLFPEQFDSHT